MFVAVYNCGQICSKACKKCTKPHSTYCGNKKVSLFKIDPGNYILPSNMYFKSLKALTCFDISRY